MKSNRKGKKGRIAYRRVGRLHLGSQPREPSETPTRAIGIVIFADRAAYRGGGARFPEHVIAARVGRVTLVGARVRIRPGLVRAVERFDVARPVHDSHRLPYLARRRGVVIVFLRLAAPLVHHLPAPRDGHLLLRHDGRLHAQGCLEPYRGPSQAFRITSYHRGSPFFSNARFERLVKDEEQRGRRVSILFEGLLGLFFLEIRSSGEFGNLNSRRNW